MTETDKEEMLSKKKLNNIVRVPKSQSPNPMVAREDSEVKGYS